MIVSLNNFRKRAAAMGYQAEWEKELVGVQIHDKGHFEPPEGLDVENSTPIYALTERGVIPMWVKNSHLDVKTIKIFDEDEEFIAIRLKDFVKVHGH